MYHQVFLLKCFCPKQFFCPDNSNMFQCLNITFILISEQPKMSWSLFILSKWFNRTKESHNQTLIGCLVVQLRSKFGTESSKPCIYLVFWQELVISVEWTQHSYFSDPFFKISDWRLILCWLFLNIFHTP